MAKKGQGALEYLMTYGWAILVIVIVVAALFALGILNPGTYVQENCRGLTYFQWKDTKLTSTALSIELINGQKDVTVTGVSFGGTALTLTSTAVTAGKSFVLSPTGDPTTKNAGDTYSAEALKISYDITGGITGNTDAAQCSGKVE